MLRSKHLEKDSLLTKETLQSKVGRPKMLYKPASKLLDTVQRPRSRLWRTLHPTTLMQSGDFRNSH